MGEHNLQQSVRFQAASLTISLGVRHRPRFREIDSLGRRYTHFGIDTILKNA
jgi:hypothetical protein